MKRLLAGLSLLALSSPAFATDVINQDGKKYTVTIVEGSYTSSKSLGANGSIYGLCTTGPCTFKIKGSSITVGKDARITINGGKFTKN
jgi:hypothetical protein